MDTVQVNFMRKTTSIEKKDPLNIIQAAIILPENILKKPELSRNI